MMDLISTFRNLDIKGITTKIHSLSNRLIQQFNIMEVCGTHTVNIFKFGIRNALPENINLISGPGCPVCVSSQGLIDCTIELVKRNYTICTFGDMLKIPGKTGTLFDIRAQYNDSVKTVYNPSEIIQYAEKNPKKKFVLLSVGFETTIPGIANTIKQVHEKNIKNIFFLISFKTIPAALSALLQDKDTNINAFLLPGHASTIIGKNIYSFLIDEYDIPSVIAGFEPADIMLSVYLLLDDVVNNRVRILNPYSRVVKDDGNPKAVQLIYEVLEPADEIWRGIGNIPKSGLKLKDKFQYLNILNFETDLSISEPEDIKGCICGQVLKGISIPPDCVHYKKNCTPDHPIGPCMVSVEGTCAAYFKYS